MIRKEKRDAIVAQALNELDFARRHKQGKVKNWQKNEDLYYGKKASTETSRANVDLGRMQEFVHTLLSKIDNPLTFKFVKRKDSQLKRVERLNSLRNFDAQRDYWDIKDIVGKKQAILYGRAIYAYYADSADGYKPHLEPVDVYDFLVDPAAGGIDLERGNFMGHYGVFKSKEDLKQGAKDGLYISTEVQNLIESGGNADRSSQEETNKRNRTYAQPAQDAQKEMSNKGKFAFWQWVTTYEGERYYLLLNEDGGVAVRCELLKDLFANNLWPYWTWAAFPDLTEFWTPSYADYVREIFMAQSVSINQMLDNAEQINKPQKVVDVTAIEDMAQLKYRKDGLIHARGDATRAVQVLNTPSIQTPIEVFNVLESIQEKASGVTADSKGVSDEEKVGIYEGNVANAQDRFGYLNKSYSFGYQRFAQLYENGVREHLVKKVAIDILGPTGVEVDEVSRKDLFRKNETYSVIVEDSNAENALTSAEKRIKMQFLVNNKMNPALNQKKLVEMEGKLVGYTDEELRQLMDVSEFGDAELMSEAERDIESILDGKQVKPNRHANTAYKQRFVDWLSDHEEDVDDETFARFALYIRSLDPIIMSNTLRQAQERGAGMAAEAMGVPTEQAPSQPQGQLLGEPPIENGIQN